MSAFQFGSAGASINYNSNFQSKKNSIASPLSYVDHGILAANNDQPNINQNKSYTRVENILRVLKKDPDKRNSQEIHQITPFFKEIDFFREKDIKDNYFVDIVQALQYEHFDSGEYVFQDGDLGDKFYIILKGRVSVQLPYYVDSTGAEQNDDKVSINSHRSQQSQNSQQSNEKFRNTQQPMILSELSIQDALNYQNPPSARNQRISKSSLQIKGKRSQLKVDSDRYHTEVKQLHAGSGFGELALKSDKPRQASIQCLEECELASMQKKDYLRILAKIDDKSKEELLSFFLSTPYFGHWSRSMILKLLVSFHLRKVARDQIVVSEGTKNNYLFLIKEGEFEVTKKVKKDMRVDIDYSQFIKLDEHGEKIQNKSGNNMPQSVLKALPESVRVAVTNANLNEESDEDSNSKNKGINTSLKSSPMKSKNKSLNTKNQNPGELVFKRQTQSSLTKKKTHISKVTDHTFMFLGNGQIFGEESMLLKLPALYSVRCRSAHAEIFIINELEFGRRIKSNELSIRILEQNLDQKAKQVAKALLTNNSYLHQDFNSKGAFYQYDKQDQKSQNYNDPTSINDSKQNNVRGSLIQMDQLDKQFKEEKIDQQLAIKVNKQSKPEQSPLKINHDIQNDNNNHGLKLLQQSQQSQQNNSVNNNQLLNKKELDYRQTMKEMVNHYPAVSQQRRIVRKQYIANVQQIKDIIEGPEDQSNKDPQLVFQEQLAQSLAKSTNKRELINILKRKLVNAVDQNHNDHLRLLDKFLQSKIVKRYTQAQKKHYLSSKVSEAIEKNEGYHKFMQIAEKLKSDLDQKNSQERPYDYQNQRPGLHYNIEQRPQIVINSVNNSIYAGDKMSLINSCLQSPLSQRQLQNNYQQQQLNSDQRKSNAFDFKHQRTHSQNQTSTAYSKYTGPAGLAASDRDFSQIFLNFCESSNKYMSVAQSIRKSHTPSKNHYPHQANSILQQRQLQNGNHTTTRLTSGNKTYVSGGNIMQYAKNFEANSQISNSSHRLQIVVVKGEVICQKQQF
eukprot:403346159